MFHVLEFDIGILVLNTCIDTSHIVLCVIVSRWCRSAGSVYPETCAYVKKISLFTFRKPVMYVCVHNDNNIDIISSFSVTMTTALLWILFN